MRNFPERGDKVRATTKLNKELREKGEIPYADAYPKNKFQKDGTRQLISALLEVTSKREEVVPTHSTTELEPAAQRHLIRLEIFSLIRHAYRPSDIMDYLYTNYNMPAERAKKYYDECVEAIKSECDEYTLDIIRYNTAVVLQILQDTMTKGDYKNALAAVKELNVMNKVYDTKPDTNIDEVVINFGG